MFRFQAIWAIVALLSLLSFTRAFSFDAGSPTECDDLSLTWTGGSPPFQIMLTPVFGVPRNISVPLSAFDNGKGSFSVQLPLAERDKFVITMSDATGFGTGGSTDVLTVGASKGGRCDTNASVAFSYQLNAALQQCRPYKVEGYAGAIQPVTFYGIVPHGTSFAVQPPIGSSFEWIANVAHDTSLIFFMVDSRGRQGGSSNLLTVSRSDDTSCLQGNSPSSTSDASTATSSGHSTTKGTGNHPTSTGSTTASPSSEPSGGISIGAIAGTVIGALLFIAIVITMGLFYIRKKRDGNDSGFRRYSQQPHVFQSHADLGHTPNSHPYSFSTHAPVASTGSSYPSYPFHSQGNINPFESTSTVHYQNSTQYYPASQLQNPAPYQDITPYQSPTSQHPSPYQPYSNVNVQPQNSLPNPHGPPSTIHDDVASSIFQAEQSSSTTRSESAAHQRKAAMAGQSSYAPSRFILHTDADDVLPPNEDGVVELPPQYSERKGSHREERSSLPYAQSQLSPVYPPSPNSSS